MKAYIYHSARIQTSYGMQMFMPNLFINVFATIEETAQNINKFS